MNREEKIKKDLEDSIWSFENVVKPYIKKWLKLKKIWVLEKQETEIQEVLDKFAGIDYQGQTYDNHIITLSSRIQWLPEKEYLRKYYPYNSYTLRRARVYEGKIYQKVDYYNKLQSILKGYSYPVYHSEAYLTERNQEDSLLSLGLCKTRDLIFFIKNGVVKKDYDLRYTPDNGLAYFYAIYFDRSYFQHNKEFPIFSHSIQKFISEPFQSTEESISEIFESFQKKNENENVREDIIFPEKPSPSNNRKQMKTLEDFF